MSKVNPVLCISHLRPCCTMLTSQTKLCFMHRWKHPKTWEITPHNFKMCVSVCICTHKHKYIFLVNTYELVHNYNHSSISIIYSCHSPGQYILLHCQNLLLREIYLLNYNSCKFCRIGQWKASLWQAGICRKPVVILQYVKAPLLVSSSINSAFIEIVSNNMLQPW